MAQVGEQRKKETYWDPATRRWETREVTTTGEVESKIAEEKYNPVLTSRELSQEEVKVLGGLGALAAKRKKKKPSADEQAKALETKPKPPK